MRSDFQERKDNRINRYNELSEKATEKSHRCLETAHDMAQAIPFGQPILIGHHSEKRDRNYRGKIENKFEQSRKEHEKSKHYAIKASAAENNNAIFSDDPEAIVKLKEKIAKLTKMQDTFKACNKIVKRKKGTQEEKIAELAKIDGVSFDNASKLFTPDFAGRIGIASYVLTNNNANIRTAKQRLEKLQRESTHKTTEITINGIRLVDNVEDNRLQMFFDGKPSDEIRTKLKSNGFRWSRYVGCWQRHRSNRATYAAKDIANNI